MTQPQTLSYDQLKSYADRINAEQLFRQLSPGTELKAI